MKSIIIFALLVAFATAFDLRKLEVTQRERFMPVLDRASNNERITNGQTAATNEFRYQVGLSFSDGSGSIWCSGSLISNEWVLTAARCAYRRVSAVVQLGSNSRLRPAVSFIVYEEDMIIFEGYEESSELEFDQRFDIAVIRIPFVEYTDAIKNVLLPNEYPFNNYFGYYAIATGWGRTSDASQSLATELQYAIFTVISNEECAETYGYEVEPNDRMCVKQQTNSTSLSEGDVGSPLVLFSSYLIGIFLHGGDKCELNIPLVNTRVTPFLGWITDKTGIETVSG